MKLFELTSKRRESLGNFCLNTAVASMVVAVYEHKWWGIPIAIFAIICFFIITKEK